MEEKFVNQIQTIYNNIGDDLSKEIFTNRLLYNLTGDNKYMLSIIETTEEGKEFINKLKSLKKPKLIFGTGFWGKEILAKYKEFSFECFIDNNSEKVGKIIDGLKVISFSEYLDKYKDACVLIATKLYHKQIYKQLIDNNVKSENIIDIGQFGKYLEDKQYFDLPELKNKQMKHETFVDAGCYDGNTSVLFTRWCNNYYDKIYAFEPNVENIENIDKKLNGYKYKIFNIGLWDCKDELKFTQDESSSHINDDGVIKIFVEQLDNLVNEPVTFLKMDIEGAEYRALLGAKNIIQKYKPKLAICVYHNLEDIWKLPSLILELNPEYKLYFRHYSLRDSETIVYAI